MEHRHWNTASDQDKRDGKAPVLSAIHSLRGKGWELASCHPSIARKSTCISKDKTRVHAPTTKTKRFAAPSACRSPRRPPLHNFRTSSLVLCPGRRQLTYLKYAVFLLGVRGCVELLLFSGRAPTPTFPTHSALARSLA